MAVDLTTKDAVATVVLNRPEALNAFNTDQLRAVINAFAEIKQDRSVRIVILTGAGDRAFAAGADIKEMVGLDRDGALQFGRLGHAMTRAVETLPQPVIAAVNGFAMGGGCELALAADFRLASENAVFGQPEVGLGIPPGWGGTQRLTRAVGPGMAAEMILTGRKVKADEALRIGLVNAVFAQSELLEKYDRTEQPGRGALIQTVDAVGVQRSGCVGAGHRVAVICRRICRSRSKSGHGRLCREADPRAGGLAIARPLTVGSVTADPPDRTPR